MRDWPDLFVIEQFFEPVVCEAIVAGMKAAEGSAVHVELSLGECEEPQFLRYREGDFFVAHQDGNTGLLRLDSELRRVSIVIFLSRQSEYGGGSLVLTDLRAPTDRARFEVSAEPGMLVAFRSETTHEVTPVTHGERLSIVSWYR